MGREQTELTWSWDGHDMQIGLDVEGAGPILLLLPALSSISTRTEMHPLQERLADAFRCVTVDWPGFGDRPKPRMAWRPAAYRAFLEHLLTNVVRPTATVAAGHAAGYLLAQAAEQPGSAGRLCLVAPTWRGPLPTMSGRKAEAFRWISGAVDHSLLGPLLYRLNVNRFMLGVMGRGHVYADPKWLTGTRLGGKLAVTRAPGARHASFRFVTGQLDPMPDRSSFCAAAGRVSDMILLIYGSGTPRKSRAEIEALAALPNVRTVKLPFGKLSVHEEFPDAVADAIRDFLQGGTPSAAETA